MPRPHLTAVSDPAPADRPEPDRRVPGRRGQATRRRLLDSTAAMLDRSSYRDLRVSDIAREASMSPATFYQYFADVEAAILVLAEEMALDGGRLVDVVRAGSWHGEDGVATAGALVDAFFDFWEAHRPVLRVVDLATEEGDQRFRQMRTRLLNAVTVALADVVRQFRDDGLQPPDVEPLATAGTLVAMLAHVAGHRYGFEFWGIRTADIRLSMSRQLYWGATGQIP